MHILVTNDDGVQAPGLLSLAQAMRKIGRVTVLAPDRNWSVAGHSKTLHKPLTLRESQLKDGSTALATNGGPTDCVALGLEGVIDKPVDLVVSGINPFANLGQDVTYSGTVGAVIEACIFGVPGLAVSIDGNEKNLHHLDYSACAEIATRVAARMLAEALPTEVILNLNVPTLPLDQIHGIRITRLGKRIYHGGLIPREDPRGRPYYWYAGGPPGGVPEADTDIGALAEGFASLTPIHLDLTAHDHLDYLKKRDWGMMDG